MTKQEAQTIIDKIPKDTIIDNNWLRYLLLEQPSLVTLRALYIVSEVDYYLFLERNEGECITKFQTKQEIYVGKVINYLHGYYLIVSQYDGYVHYINNDGELSHLEIKGIEPYLIS